MVNINTEAVLTTFTRLGRFLSLRCLVILDFDIALCSSCGLATAIGHINVYQAAVLAPLRFPRSFIAHRLLPPCFLHLGYHWSLCLAQLAPACGVASIPIHPGCHRPFPRSVVRSSAADACRGLPLCFLFDFCFSIPRSLTLDRRCFSISSLRPSSLTGPSPCILPAGAYWLPHAFGDFCCGHQAPPGFHKRLWKVACSKRLLILSFSGNHRCCGRMP